MAEAMAHSVDDVVGDHPHLLSIEAAARKLGVGRSTMYVLMGTGEVETVKVGRRRLIVPESLPAYVERLRAQQREAS